MLRDRLTFAMAIGVPILQLVLFGYAINTDPKGLPTALVADDSGPMARSVVAALQNTGYFRISALCADEDEAAALIETGAVQFMIAIPPDFSRRVVRGERPAILVAADATDPSASGNAMAALAAVADRALAPVLVGPLASLQPAAAPFEIRVHRRYNPEGLSRYNIVPGLIGTILTMTMVMLTGLAMTRERERGTMENLLATPVRPFEVMLGKIVPYVVIGYIQLAVIMTAAALLFEVPMVGSFVLLMAMIGVFIAREPRGRLHVLDAGPEPAAGDADDVLLLPAVDAAVGLHVPVSRHARVGAVARRGAAADPLPAHRARHHAEGKQRRPAAAGAVADARLSRPRRRTGAGALSTHARLTNQAARDLTNHAARDAVAGPRPQLSRPWRRSP